MSDAAKLWAVHVIGPDTVMAQPDHATAEARAKAWDAMIAGSYERNPRTENDPEVRCEVVEWCGRPEDHAEWLAAHGGNPEDIC